jgi:hypothetical protein
VQFERTIIGIYALVNGGKSFAARGHASGLSACTNADIEMAIVITMSLSS